MTTNGNGSQNGEALKVRVGNEVQRQEFGATQMARTGETASTALATQARAAVEARFVMALQRPRDMESVRVQILAACRRPLFAEDALYSKPVGRVKNDETGNWEEKFIEGLSIRFAEEAVRVFGNVMTDTVTIYDDPQKRIVRLSATDLQTNVVHNKDITVEKTVERRYLKKGQVALGQRLNSYGETTFLVEATEDDLAKKEGALVAKAIRDKMLMLVPSDIKEEARDLVKETQKKKDAQDPDAAKRKVIDSFAAIGVMPAKIADYLGHDLGAVQPAELQELRKIYSAIKDGEATWASFVEQKAEGKPEQPAAKPDGAAAPPAEGKRISLKTPAGGASQAPGAPTTIKSSAPPAEQPPAKEPASITIVKDGKEGAAVAAAISRGTPSTDDVISRPPPPAEDAGDAPTEAEIAAAEAGRGRQSSLPVDDDLPPGMGGKGKPTGSGR